MSTYGLMRMFAAISFNNVKRGKVPRMYPEFLAPGKGVQAVRIGICGNSFNFLLGLYVNHVHSTSKSVSDENGAISNAGSTERTVSSVCKKYSKLTYDVTSQA